MKIASEPRRVLKVANVAHLAFLSALFLVCSAHSAPLDIVGTSIIGGNGDHLINPNECNDLGIVVTNNSGVSVTGISCVLSVYTVLGVEITQPYSAFPDIPAFGSATNVTPFQISSLPSYICRDPVNLQLLFRTASHGSFAVPLTIPPSGVCTPGSGPCGFCLPPISGSITSGDPVASGRLSRNAAISDCAAPKSFPGMVSGNVHYDVYAYTNTYPFDACVSISLSANCDVEASAYSGSFDPSNLASNYLGDSVFSTGQGLGTNFPFSCTVPAGSRFVVVVNEIDSNAGCTNYTLALSGLACAPPALAIETISNSTARLSWPDSVGGYILESSPSALAPQWSAVTNEPLVDGGTYSLTNETTATTKFYRLHKP